VTGTWWGGVHWPAEHMKGQRGAGESTPAESAKATHQCDFDACFPASSAASIVFLTNQDSNSIIYFLKNMSYICFIEEESSGYTITRSTQTPRTCSILRPIRKRKKKNDYSPNFYPFTNANLALKSFAILHRPASAEIFRRTTTWCFFKNIQMTCHFY
jgi:hypothetical protein